MTQFESHFVRCAATHLGLGCSREAEPNRALCRDCHDIAFGPWWNDPILWPLGWILRLLHLKEAA